MLKTNKEKFAKARPNIIKSNLSYLIGALVGWFLCDYFTLKYGNEFDLIEVVSQNLELLGVSGGAFGLITYIYENKRQD